MSKTYYYRKHIRLMKKVFLATSLIFLAVAVLFLIVLEGEDKVFGSITMAGLALYLYLFTIFFKRFSTTEITIDDQGVRFKNSAKDFFIRYEEIKAVNTRSISNLGGYFTIEKTRKETIRITVVLENIHEFVKRLKEELDKREIDIYNERKLYKFYILSFYSDTSWARLYKNFLGLTLSYSLMIGLFVVVVAVKDASENLSLAYNMFVGSVVIFLITFLYYEFGVFSKQIKKESNPDTWQLPDVDIDETARKIMKPLYVLTIIVTIGYLYVFIK